MTSQELKVLFIIGGTKRQHDWPDPLKSVHRE